MRCSKCGQEVDTNLFAACPNCRTLIPTSGYQSEIGMRDSIGNTMTVGGNLNQQPKRKINRKTIITIILIIVAINVLSCVVWFGFIVNRPRTYEEKIKLAREDAVKVVNQQLKYKNLNDWYANTYIDDDGNNKFIIYCDVYGYCITGEYGRIQMYVGIELKDNSSDYVSWRTGNIYPNGDSTPNEYEPAYAYVQQLKDKMGWE